MHYYVPIRLKERGALCSPPAHTLRVEGEVIHWYIHIIASAAWVFWALSRDQQARREANMLSGITDPDQC